MALQFIIGPAGSGKSTYVMQHVAEELKKNNRKKIILMVPEQATFCYQYEFITQYGLNGVLTLEILSFQRLARTIMQQTGGMARQSIDELGKLLVLRRILQENHDTYPYLSQSVNRSGYLMKLGDTIQELKRYQVTPDLLAHTLQAEQIQSSLFGSKVAELSGLYGGYEAFIAQDYVDSEDTLNILLAELDHTDYLQDTEIWVDEFYDFTPQEMAILAKLMQSAKDVHIVLPLDHTSQNPGRKAVFHHTQNLYDRLRAMAVEKGVAIQPDYVCTDMVRWDEQDTLAFLEAEYFAIGSKIYESNPQGLTLIQCQNRLSEADYAARTIRALCRENGYRYGDIAVFTRGEQYQHILETVFTDYDIPYFIDHKESVHQHPLTETILAVFEMIRSHWSYQSVFRLLKTGLLPFEHHEIDVLENYVLQYGIRGSAWYGQADWQYPVEYSNADENAEILAQLNELRIRIAAPIRQLQIALESAQTADAMVQSFYTMLETYQIPARLEWMCQDAMQHQLPEQAQIHQQIWDKLTHIFNQITLLLQDTPLSADSFYTILQSAVENLDLGLLPSSLDQVFIGALAHSRARNLKAVFVLGLNEGVFPAKTAQDGFFNDIEKQLLRDMGIQLSQDSREKIYDEQFMVYLAISRASEKLYMSYSLSDEEGKALRPSSIVDKLCRLYPHLTKATAQWPPNDGQDLLPYLSHKHKALGLLGGYLTDESHTSEPHVWIDLYRWFTEHSDHRFQTFQQNMLHPDVLSAPVLNHTELFGAPLRLSVSALETYRKCPYSYFLTYGLRLKERKLYQIEAVDTGSFYHTAIEQFSNYLIEQQISWQSLDAVKVKAIMGQIVDCLAPELQNQILMSSGRYQYIRRRLQKTLEQSALILMEHGQRGEFVPVALEAEFGAKGSTMPGYRITLEDGTSMYLQGKIDRIEHAKAGDTGYLRVIDFKSGKQGLDLTEVYYGLKIQLLTYLRVALQYYETLLPEGETLLPAGVLYYFFRSGILQADGPINPSEAQAMHHKDVRANGLLLADMHGLKLADRTLSTGSSNLLPLTLLSKAEQYIDDPDSFDALEDPMELFGKRNHTVVSKEQLSMLLAHVEQLIQMLGDSIHKGNISIQPCRLKQMNGCKYCNYQAICRIQTVDFFKNSEELIPLTHETIWSRLESQTNRKGANSNASMDN